MSWVKGMHEAAREDLGGSGAQIAGGLEKSENEILPLGWMKM